MQKKLLATMESFCICAYAVSFQAHFIHSGAGVSVLSSQQERSGFELPGQLGRGGYGVCCSSCAFFGGFLPQSRSMHVRFMGTSEYTVGVGINGVQSLCPRQRFPNKKLMDRLNNLI